MNNRFKAKDITYLIILIIVIISNIFQLFTVGIPLATKKKKIVENNGLYNSAIICLPNNDIIEGKLDYYKNIGNDMMEISIDNNEYMVSNDRIVITNNKE